MTETPVESPWVTREFRRLAELIGLCGVAIAQPVLASFGAAPAQFSFRGVDGSGIVVFALLVAILPAIALWVPGAVVRAAHSSTGAAVHHGAVAFVVYLGVNQLGHEVGLAGMVKAGVALVVAAGVVWAFRVSPEVGAWARLLALLTIVFVGLFLFASEAGELVFRDPPAPVELDFEPSAAVAIDGEEPTGPPDVILLVLDELPTALLLGDEGGIDSHRYPNVAEFAGDATWFRSHTSTSAQTVAAVPTILSGQIVDDRESAVWTEQPDTLFRLLGGSYHLVVSEGSTSLCPVEWCGGELRPPAPPTSIAADDSEPSTTVTSTTSPPVAAATFDRGGLRSLLDDAVDIIRARTALDRDDSPDFVGFEETIVDNDEPAPSTTSVAPTTTDISTADTDGLDESGVELEEVPLPPRQVPRVDEFRSTFAIGADPTLYYLHLVLPHRPFLLTETGEEYAGPRSAIANQADWDTKFRSARMSLQMQFTDVLVGQILDSAREAGIYDDALVIVMADHGASADTSSHYRYYDGLNAAGIMVAPLMMKLPGQTEGEISTLPSESPDVLPTIADVLGVTIPWEVDGTSLLAATGQSTGAGECSDPRTYVRLGVGILPDEEDDDIDIFELCAEDFLAEGLEPIVGPSDPDDEWATAWLARETPYEELLGASLDDLDVRPDGGEVMIDAYDSIVGEGSPPYGVVRGTVSDLPEAEWIVVSLDDRIIGMSPVYDRLATTRYRSTGETFFDHFAVMIPTAYLDADGSSLRVAGVSRRDGDLVLTELTIEN